MAGGSLDGFDRLVQIIKRLRAPDGCAWDREQTPESLRSSLVSEAWECVSAIDARDDANLEEELGDLYLNVTLLAYIKEQQGSFTVSSALSRICEKLIRRHPHVFSDSEARSVPEILVQWDAIKAGEKAAASANAGSALDRVSRSLPPLERAAELQRKASKVGFDWPSPGPVWDKVGEEMNELRKEVAAGADGRIEEEVGDLLFSVVNLSRLLGVDPAVALNGANAKFDRRFRAVEGMLAEQGVKPADAGLQRMDELWNRVKAQEREGCSAAGAGDGDGAGGGAVGPAGEAAASAAGDAAAPRTSK
jgi:tetrapyrrole methylase family protein / MazG family protein